MIIALYLVIALLVVGVALWLHEQNYRRSHPTASESSDKSDPSDKSETSGGNAAEAADGECCGLHITCERDSLLASVSETVDYYDDEDLDKYRDRTADSYDDAEIEQFRDVLLTLLPQDIAGWARSIQLRGIELPAIVREELLMIVAEERRKASAPKPQ